MKTYQIASLKTATLEAKKVGDELHITATKKAAEKMQYPFTDGRIYNADGKNYKSIEELQNDFGIKLTEVAREEDDEPEAEDAAAVVILDEVQTEGNFESIQQLRNLQATFARKFNRQPNIEVTLTIITGKYRPNGKAKAWIENPLKMTANVEAIKTKWLFLSGQYYAKEFTNAAYKLS